MKNETLRQAQEGPQGPSQPVLELCCEVVPIERRADTWVRPYRCFVDGAVLTSPRAGARPALTKAASSLFFLRNSVVVFEGGRGFGSLPVGLFL